MANFKKSDLYYTDYSDTAVEGDDPTKVRLDRTRFSRRESYEVLSMINSINFTQGSSDSVIHKGRRIIEWMIHEHLPSETQSRDSVTEWIYKNYSTMSVKFPR